MVKKVRNENMTVAGGNDQVEKMSFDELTSVTGGRATRDSKEDAKNAASSRGAMVARYGQLMKQLQNENVPNRDKLLQEFHQLQLALQRG